MKIMGVKSIRIDEIHVPIWAVREFIPKHELEDLKRSIEAYGLQQFITVRPKADGGYELIAGYCRLTSCKALGLREVEARIVEADDYEALSLSIEENMKRLEEHPFDTARKIAYMHKELKLSTRKIGERLNRDDSWAAMMLKIDSMDPEIKKVLAEKVNDYRKLYEIASIDDPSDQAFLAEAVVERGLSYRNIVDAKRRARERGLNIREVLAHVNTPLEHKLPPEPLKAPSLEASQTPEAQKPVEEEYDCFICRGEIKGSKPKWRPLCSECCESIEDLRVSLKKHSESERRELLAHLSKLFDYLLELPREELKTLLEKLHQHKNVLQGLNLQELLRAIESIGEAPRSMEKNTR